MSLSYCQEKLVRLTALQLIALKHVLCQMIYNQSPIVFVITVIMKCNYDKPAHFQHKLGDKSTTIHFLKTNVFEQFDSITLFL